jgi:tetratricopeptide (TPR) repeat protein
MPIFTENRNDYPEFHDKEKKLSKIINENIENVSSWLARGDFYFNFGMWKQSANDFKNAIRLGENNDKIYWRLAQSYFLSGQYKESINEWSYLIDKNSEESHFYCCRGWAYRKIGDYKLSEADYTKAISLTPDTKEYIGTIIHYHYFRGQLYCEMKEYQKAIQDFKFVLTRSPNWSACEVWLEDVEHAFEHNLPFTKDNFRGYEGHPGFVEMRLARRSLQTTPH